jgi:hypothetical protein
MATKRVTTESNPAADTESTPKKQKKTSAKRAQPTVSADLDAPPLDRDARHSLVAAEAYYRAEKRGFTAGHELEDWVAAEHAIDRRLADAAVG